MKKLLEFLGIHYWKYGRQYMSLIDPKFPSSPYTHNMEIRKCIICGKKQQRVSWRYSWATHLSQRSKNWTNTMLGKDVGKLIELKSEENYP